MRSLLAAPRRAGAALEREPRLVIFLFSIIYLAITAGMAMRPLWYDELHTFYISRLPGFGAMWTSLVDGIDLNPPLLYLATAASHRLLGTGEVATRMPAIAGFLVMCLCLYAFVARRYPRSYALAAMLLPLLTNGYRYAAEARPYGMELGLAGLALVCWQRANEDGARRAWLAGMFASLAAMLLTHCFAVLIVLPFCAGQMAADMARRRVSWPVWISFAALSPVLLVYAPLFHSTRGAHVANPLFSPNAMSLPSFYGGLLEKVVWLIAALLAVAVAYRTRGGEGPVSGLRRSETVCGAVFLLLPVGAFLLAVGVTGMFFPRYGVVAMIGFAILVPAAVARLTAANPEAGQLTLALTILAMVVFSAGAILQPGTGGGADLRARLEKTRPDLPVVVSNGLMFLETDRYAAPEVARRSHFLVDSAAGLRYTGANTFDVCYLKIRKWFPLRGSVEDYGAFTARHPSFVVYGTYDFPLDWLIRRLTDEGYHLDYLGGVPDTYGTSVLLVANRPAR